MCGHSSHSTEDLKKKKRKRNDLNKRVKFVLLHEKPFTFICLFLCTIFPSLLLYSFLCCFCRPYGFIIWIFGLLFWGVKIGRWKLCSRQDPVNLIAGFFFWPGWWKHAGSILLQNISDHIFNLFSHSFWLNHYCRGLVEEISLQRLLYEWLYSTLLKYYCEYLKPEIKK